MKVFTPESQSCQESVGGAADGILPLHVQRHARCLRAVWWNPDSTHSESTVPPIYIYIYIYKSNISLKLHNFGLNCTEVLQAEEVLHTSGCCSCSSYSCSFCCCPIPEVNGGNFHGEISLMKLPSRLCPTSIGWQGMEHKNADGFSRNTSWNEQWPVHPVLAILISHYNKDPHWPTNIKPCHKVFISLAPIVYQPTNPSSNFAIGSFPK